MPKCDGWSVLSQLKADPELSRIPVIIVTIVDNEAMGINLGASSYVIKPVDRERLIALIQKHRNEYAEPKMMKIPVSLSLDGRQEQDATDIVRRR
jgi:DNA-binding response OmpR family regulator